MKKNKIIADGNLRIKKAKEEIQNNRNTSKHEKTHH